MRNALLVMAVVLLSASFAIGQECANGRCSLSDRPVVDAVASVAVLPVRAAGYVVREVQPVRTVARASVRVVSRPVKFIRTRQPVRSVLRRVFCR